MEKKQIFEFIEQNRKQFTDISDQIWEYAETAFEEHQSVKSLTKGLEDFGFVVETGIGGLKTAFKASYGSGYPVIGILGEFDALSGMSQEEFSTEKKEKQPGGNGHGCGHNMLGAGSLAAAVGVKEYLVQNKKQGTVVYFGCPGEEGGSGKAFMAKEGVFEGVDIALTWHPNYANAVMDVGMLANYQILYKFKGTASHAAATPHLGRSALDAVELMNVGVNFLREHIIPTARVHYAVTNTGGFSPNVVQPEAEVLYLIRAPKNSQVDEIYQRINKIAQGAALMTETEVEAEFIKSCSNIVPNKTLFEVMYQNLNEAPLPVYTKEDQVFAAQMAGTLTKETFDKTAFAALTPEDAKTVMTQLNNKPLCDIVAPFRKEIPSKTLPASSDVGDVSWNVPTGQIAATCYALGIPTHSWQLVSQGKSGIAHKGLLYAGKVMAGTAIDALENDQIIQEAKKELEERLEGESYICAIPDGTNPKVMGQI